jgi:hypothetical protein
VEDVAGDGNGLMVAVAVIVGGAAQAEGSRTASTNARVFKLHIASLMFSIS